jgi:hypothetical protein
MIMLSWITKIKLEQMAYEAMFATGLTGVSSDNDDCPRKKPVDMPCTGVSIEVPDAADKLVLQYPLWIFLRDKIIRKI